MGEPGGAAPQLCNLHRIQLIKLQCTASEYGI
jgi:hypothetical protein